MISKRAFLSAAAAVACLLSSHEARSEKTVPFEWSVSRASVTGTGDSLVVRMSFVFTGDLPSRDAAVFVPVLSRGDSSVAMRPIAMRGPKLKPYVVSGDPSEIIPPAGADTLDYSFSVPRREWMDSCMVDVYENVYTKKSDLRYRSQRGCGSFARPAEPRVVLPWNFMEPEDDPSPSRTVSFPLSLDVPDKGRSIRQDTGDNMALLQAFDSIVRPLFHGNTPRVRACTLEAYTSPVGAERANMTVTRSRLTSLQSLLVQKGTFGRRRPALQPKGEDWDGMVRWLEGSDREQDVRLHEILSTDAPADTLEAMICREKPVVWEELEALCFPDMERFVLGVEYVPFVYSTPAEAEAMYRISPYFLSARDLWMVTTVMPDAESACGVLLEAVALYPEDEATRTNAVLALTETGHMNEAAVLMRRGGGSPESVLARAIWLYRSGRYEECLPLLESLKEKGDVYRTCWECVDEWWRWNTGMVAWEYVGGRN